MSGLTKKPYVFSQPAYDPLTHCASVIAAGKLGQGLAEIATSLGVPRRILFTWAKKYPEFSYALELSQEYALAFWSQTGRDALFDPAFRSDVFSKMMGVMFPKDVSGGGGLPELADPDAANTDAQDELSRALSRRGIPLGAPDELKKSLN